MTLFVCNNQTYLRHEALHQPHQPLRDVGLVPTSNDTVKGAAYTGHQSLFLRHVVVAASAGENPPSLLEWLLEHPMDSMLIYEMKTLAADVQINNTEEGVDTSWAELTMGEDPIRED